MAPQRTARPDDGFGLIEMVVALLIAGVVFGALATTLVAGLRTSLYGRQNQQATDAMTAELERLRAVDFGSLTMDSTDLAGDPRILNCSGTPCLMVDGTPETLVLGTGGAVTPHIKTVDDGTAAGVANQTVNGTTFTVSSYITASDQPVDQAVRATVFVNWTTGSTPHERSISSMIAFTQRGLPLPRFKLEMPVTSMAVNPGGTLTYEVTLLNQGAPDRWDITLSGWSTGWSLVADTDGDGTLSAGDTPLADTTMNGQPDTGRVDPSTTFRFFLTRTTTTGAALGTFDTTVTATSVGQPSATGASASVTATSTITTGVIGPTPGPTPTPSTSPPTTETTCAAPSVGSVTGVGNGNYSVREYALHNDGVGPSTTQAQMYFNSTGPDEPYLPEYSTDVAPTTTGRVIQASGALPDAAGTLALTDPHQYADWQMTAESNTRLDGTGVLRLWIAADGGTAPTQAEVVLYSASTASGSRSVLADTSISLPTGCSGFQEVYVTLPDVPQPQIARNGVFGVRIAVAGGNGRLGYDVPGQMPAAFQIGVK
ncbi:prepilin-type N-terminal cleavage/methylation domain-containing protein [Isoptericola sp. b441]|uniref:Prepilin-type N-terminal cleavage/methylation domain-containing protein n=1 Tax=Actinotalea lenta TaxID=3064654 RepID=A0ABT9DA55_9CELL|nr:prepilin-type N-terminal cleavage/methylation domain-containing protein [Isoptericola sp. b441]MDO8107795.1 prepilin-type N-terminal cleavage/methylation domain-containing protein [Isoptericola sp. b441]